MDHERVQLIVVRLFAKSVLILNEFDIIPRSFLGWTADLVVTLSVCVDSEVLSIYTQSFFELQWVLQLSCIVGKALHVYDEYAWQ